jgi:hypothetical protein
MDKIRAGGGGRARPKWNLIVGLAITAHKFPWSGLDGKTQPIIIFSISLTKKITY